MTTCYTKVSKGSFDLYSVNSFHVLHAENTNCQRLDPVNVIVIAFQELKETSNCTSPPLSIPSNPLNLKIELN